MAMSRISFNETWLKLDTDRSVDDRGLHGGGLNSSNTGALPFKLHLSSSACLICHTSNLFLNGVSEFHPISANVKNPAFVAPPTHVLGKLIENVSVQVGLGTFQSLLLSATMLELLKKLKTLARLCNTVTSK